MKSFGKKIYLPVNLYVVEFSNCDIMSASTLGENYGFALDSWWKGGND